MRCSARHRERQLGAGYGFGMFVDGEFAGEINLSSVQRGPFQSAYVGYWIDEAKAGNSYTPEAVVVVARFAFEELRLHRIQIAIIPRNRASRRVMEKLDIRDEGTAVRYLEINGTWEDHVRYAITAEEWAERSEELLHRLDRLTPLDPPRDRRRGALRALPARSEERVASPVRSVGADVPGVVGVAVGAERHAGCGCGARRRRWRCRAVTTSARSSWAPTRTMATRSYSPVTE